MRKVIYSFFFIFLTISCHKKDDREEMHKLNSQIEILVGKSKDESLPKHIQKELSDSLLVLVNLQPKSFEQRQNLFKVANRYYNLREHRLERIITDRIISESLDARDTISLARGYEYKGDYYNILELSDSAMLYYFKSKELYIRNGNHLKVAEILLLISIIKTNQNDLIGGESVALESLKTFKSVNDLQNMAYVYNILGKISNDLDDFEGTVEMYERGIKILEDDDKPRNLYCLNLLKHNLGLVLFENKKYEDAYKIFKNLLNNDLYESHTSMYASVLSNYASLRHKLNPGTDDIVSMFNRAVSIHDSVSTLKMGVLSRNQFVDYYMSIGDTLNAKALSISAYNLSIDEPYYKALILSTLKNLIKTDPRNAINYSLEYIRLNDSIQLAERQMKTKFERIEFETDELEAERNEAIISKGIYINIFGLVVIIAGIAVFLIYRNMSSIKKQYDKFRKNSDKEVYSLIIEQQSKVSHGQTIEKNRISRELHDGVLNDLSYVRNRLAMAISENTASGVQKCIGYLDNLQEIERQIHTISRDLRNPVVNVKSYRKLLNDLFALQQDSSEIKWQFHQDASIKWKKFNSQSKINIYRILQESIRNITKHSSATHASVKITESDGKLIIEISDNGVGFDVTSRKNGTGLQNIQMRVGVDGGSFDLQTDTNKGVKIILVYSI